MSKLNEIEIAAARRLALAKAVDRACAALSQGTWLTTEEVLANADELFNWLLKHHVPLAKDIEVTLPEGLTRLVLNTPGEFYQTCYQQFDLMKSQVDAEIPGVDLADPEQRKQAWLGIIKRHQQKG